MLEAFCYQPSFLVSSPATPTLTAITSNPNIFVFALDSSISVARETHLAVLLAVLLAVVYEEHVAANAYSSLVQYTV